MDSAQCYVAVWMGGKFRENAYVWLSPFTLDLKLSQHCELAIPRYKLKIEKNKNKMELTIIPTGWDCHGN